MSRQSANRTEYLVLDPHRVLLHSVVYDAHGSSELAKEIVGVLHKLGVVREACLGGLG